MREVLIKDLPFNLRILAYNRMRNEGYSIEDNSDNVRLRNAFTWDKTAEGESFWMAIEKYIYYKINKEPVVSLEELIDFLLLGVIDIFSKETLTLLFKEIEEEEKISTIEKALKNRFKTIL